MYWAQALANQNKNTWLKERFTPVAQYLKEHEEQINRELLAAQGRPVDIGGYYKPDETRVEQEMRPSATLNAIINRMMEK